MSKIVLFGADGKLGARVIAEANSRGGHRLTAVVRERQTDSALLAGTEVRVGDAADPALVGDLANGADVLVSVVGGPDKTIYLRVAQNLVATVARMADAGPRILHSGGSGSLLDADGNRFVDEAGFPEGVRQEALGQSAALDYYRTSEGVTWTYMSPASNFAPGERRGTYRLGKDHPVVGADGVSRISYEDYAVALVDEIENGAFLNTRFTVGY